MKRFALLGLLSCISVFCVVSSCKKEDISIPVTGVTLSSTSVTIVEGEEIELEAFISPKKASNQEVIWITSNPSVAKVHDGIITGIAVGNAEITVKTDDGGFTDVCKVTVNPKFIAVSKISLIPNEVTLVEGEEVKLGYTISPSNATNQTVTWSSDEASVAQVVDGVVTALKAGTATVTVHADDGNKTATCNVTVKPRIIPVSRVSLDQTMLVMTEGYSETLVASIYPENASNKEVVWSSNNAGVASVVDGTVNALKVGTATITVKTDDGAKTASCLVTVNAKVYAVTGVSLDKPSLTLTEGDTQQLVATIAPSNATNKSVTWSSNNSSVASVDQNGNVSALKAGTATITVKTVDGGKTAECQVSVASKVIRVTGVNISKVTLSLTEGESEVLTASVIPENATNRTIRWSSDNVSVATVKDGLVKAISSGTTIIRATSEDGSFSAACVVSVDVAIKPITGDVSHISCVSATVSGRGIFPTEIITSSLELGILYSTSSGVIPSTSTKIKATSLDADYNFNIGLSNLTPGTTYYYRAYVSSNGMYLGDTKSFTTKAVSDVIRTDDVTNLQSKTATLNGFCDPTDYPATSVTTGFYYGTSQTSLSSKVTASPQSGKLSYTLTSLQTEKTYYYAAFIKFDGTEYRGDIKSFKTVGFNVTVTPQSASDITEQGMTLNASYSISSNDLSASSVFFLYSPTATTLENLKSSGTKVTASISDAQNHMFKASLTSLKYNTRYYYIAGVVVSGQTFYSSVQNVKTPDINATVTTSGSVVTSETRANLTGNLVCNTILTFSKSVYFLYGQSLSSLADLKASGTKVTATLGSDGSYTKELTALVPGTTYYYVACAKVSDKEFYGSVKSFTTNDVGVIADAASSISSSSMVMNGHLDYTTTDALSPSAYFLYSKTYKTVDDLKTSGTKIAATLNGKNFTCTVSSLSPKTTYYYIAAATIKGKTTYSSLRIAQTAAGVPTLTTPTSSGITYCSATVASEVTSSGGESITECGIVYSTQSNPSIDNGQKLSYNNPAVGKFTISITGLSPATKYYIRSYATNSVGTAYSTVANFTTQAVVPTLTTKVVSSITSSSAVSGGDISSDGGASVTARGVVWSTSPSPTINGNKTNDGTGTGSFTSNMTGLLPSTKYYVRAYASNAIGTAYGEEQTFVTDIALPVVVTSDITDITSSSAKGGGSITSDGGSEIIAKGVVWSTSQNPTISLSTKTNDGTGTLSYTSTLSNLNPGTTYYVRAYATNAKGTAYGEQKTFSSGAVAPTLKTLQVTSITSNSASSGGNISSTGGSAVTARGVVWSTSPNPTISLSTKTSNGTGSGTFASSIYGLEPVTTYYVRAYATNAIGTSYGDELKFTTQIGLPVVTTSNITDITSDSAKGGGSITSDGGSEITERGIVWSTSKDPTISLSTKTIDGSGTSSFISSITGLKPGTTYYVRAYATNAAGTAYGSQVSFKSDYILPSVETAIVSAVGLTFASCGGTITNTGGASITQKGVVWSTSNNPTISLSSKSSDGWGSSAFSSAITGLLPGTLYYVRAYATNSKGTSYGEIKTFTTAVATAVDLGLSVKWANTNIGAASPYEHGDYFAWGETDPYYEYGYSQESPQKHWIPNKSEGYYWPSYTWCNGSQSTLNKYNFSASYGSVDKKTVLELNDDAANKKLNGDWRIPTEAEFEELRTSCSWSWTTINGVSGYNVKGKNGNSIFLPASGYRGGKNLSKVNEQGFYWTSELRSSKCDHSINFRFSSTGREINYESRYFGHSIRAVSEK